MVWYDLDRTITVYGAVVNATATYLVEDACGAPLLRSRLQGSAGRGLRLPLFVCSSIISHTGDVGVCAVVLPNLWGVHGMRRLWVYTIRH